MIDYRDELGFRISLIIFLVNNFSTNRNGKKQLSIEKLKLLTFTCLTPRKLERVSNILNKTSIKHLKNIFYDESSSNYDNTEIMELSLLISYMCNITYLEVLDEDSKFVVLGENAKDISKPIDQAIPKYMAHNMKLIRAISTKSESLITKALMDV